MTNGSFQSSGHSGGASRERDGSAGGVPVPPRKGRRRQLTPEEQLEIVRRVQSGEMQSDIARELGYTRQRISAIMKKFEQAGAEGFRHRKRGRKAGPVPMEEVAPLITMLRDQLPADFGFRKGDFWTYEKAEAAGIRVLGRKPPKSYLRTAFREAGIELQYDSDPDEGLFTPEFKAYLKSAKAREIREREADYRRRLEEQGLVNKRPKIGRPTREEAARKAQPWKPGDRDADDPAADAEDAELPDWNNMTPEEMRAFRDEHGLAPYLAGPGSHKPGDRTGKHRKQKAPGGSRRRKGKGRKKR